MKPSDYIFNVGDEVIAVNGEKGYITYICHCERCAERGFFEPSWEDDCGEMHYISNYEAENGFVNYYSVGNYRFNSFRKDMLEEKLAYYEDITKRLKKQLRLINELEGFEHATKK